MPKRSAIPKRRKKESAVARELHEATKLRTRKVPNGLESSFGNVELDTGVEVGVKGRLAGSIILSTSRLGLGRSSLVGVDPLGGGLDDNLAVDLERARPNGLVHVDELDVSLGDRDCGADVDTCCEEKRVSF